MLRAFAAEQLVAPSTRLDVSRDVPDGRVAVCLRGGEVWWRSSRAEAKRHLSVKLILTKHLD